MKKQEQIDRLQFRIEQAEKGLSDIVKAIVNIDKPIIITSPEGTWVKNWRDNSGLIDNPAIIQKGESIMNNSEKPNSCEIEYPSAPNGIISIPYGLTDSKEKEYIEAQKQIMQDAFEIKRDKFMEKFKQPESTQYELPDFVPDWKDAPEGATYLAMDKDGQWWWYGNKAVISSMSFIGDWINSYPGQCTNATRLHPEYWKQSLQERPEPDYTHLLPCGYEFCSEQDAEKWVKVQLNLDIPESEQTKVGYVWHNPIRPFVNRYRPIRPIQYHVAIHEGVTAEPDPYQVDWGNAPEGAIAHAYDISSFGYWYTRNIMVGVWMGDCVESPNRLQSGLDWKKSLRLNPKLK